MAKEIGVETLTHKEAKRLNIPTAEFQSVMAEDEKAPIRVAYARAGAQSSDGGDAARRNRDLDPQLVWRGKDEQDWSDLIVQAPPLYIQEKVHPKVLVEDLKRETKARAKEAIGNAFDLFADFNGLPDKEAATEFYQHDINWNNRMILGDSLSVMASLAEREGLRGQVQCIYFDPPYGIKFNSNFQWSTTSRDVKDGKADHVTREPEQVRAFRDTWRDGIHSYLSYLRDRLTVARDLLTDSGSVFVQIGDENVHRVRAVMDEVFGDENCIAIITVQKAGSTFSQYLGGIADFVLWYGKSAEKLKYRELFAARAITEDDTGRFTLAQIAPGLRVSTRELDRPATLSELVAPDPLQSASMGREKGEGAASWFPVNIGNQVFRPTMQSRWKTNEDGMRRLTRADRIIPQKNSIRYARRFSDFSVSVLSNIWTDLAGATDKVYVVQTSTSIVQRCILMATDPGDLVLDPTCGSGTTAYVAEQWGRRWITIDTSRVSLALARARIMGARYPYYLLADSREGQVKEGQITRTPPKDGQTRGDIRQGFVYERVPHITLKSIANNAEIDVIWDKAQEVLEPLRAKLNAALGTSWEEWEIPRELPAANATRMNTDSRDAASRMNADHKKSVSIRAPGAAGHPRPSVFPETDAPDSALGLTDEAVPFDHPADTPERLHAQWWETRIQRQKDIDASIAARAESEYLYDKPYEDKAKVRVAGPFTVESLSPHRVLAVDHDDELVDMLDAAEGRRLAAERDETDFAQMILENLKAAGVQQAHKENRITFTAITGWPGDFICAEGLYMEGEQEAGSGEAATGKQPRQRRAGIFIGPEFGTVSRPDLVAAAREAGDGGFDVLIACAFNFDAHSAEFDKLGRIPVLKARMNPDLHMGGELKSTGAGNLFVVFGEPDIDITKTDTGQVQVKIKGVDIFHPSTGEIESGGPDTIAVWFIDTDYNEESFFVRHAYFLGANDPYKSLKTTLKAEIDREAWDSLNSDTSRPFDKPKSGRIAVKVINHLGDEVMKVFGVA